MNIPQTDQDLYHDPEALSPTFFFRWLWYFTKGKSSFIKTFFYENVQNPLIHFFVCKNHLPLSPPHLLLKYRICTYVHTSLNRFLGRSRYLRNSNTLQISNSILQNFYFMQIYHIFTFEGLKLPKTMFWTILRQIKIFIMILKLSAQLFFQMIMIFHECHPKLTFLYEKWIWKPRIGPGVTGFMWNTGQQERIAFR